MEKHQTPTRRALFSAFLALFVPLALVSTAAAQTNLLTNGDFSAGNMGFTAGSSYIFTAPSIPKASTTTPGQYGVGTTPAAYSAVWADFADHTTPHGNLLIVDAASTSPADFAWEETVTGLTMGRQYVFTGFLTSDQSMESSLATIQVGVGGTLLGTETTAPSVAGVYVSFGATYTATGTSATFQIFDTNVTQADNDFAVDDLSLVQVPEPTTTALLIAAGAGSLGWLCYRRRLKTAA